MGWKLAGVWLVAALLAALPFIPIGPPQTVTIRLDMPPGVNPNQLTIEHALDLWTGVIEGVYELVVVAGAALLTRRIAGRRGH